VRMRVCTRMSTRVKHRMPEKKLLSKTTGNPTLTAVSKGVSVILNP